VKRDDGDTDEKRRFTDVFSDTYNPIRRYLRRRVTPDAVDDLVGQVYATAWSRWSDVRSPELPWLYGVARNVVREWRRQEGHRSLIDFVDPAEIESVISDDTATDRASILAALRSLKPEDLEVLLMVGWEALGASEAAMALGISVPTLRVRLHRARSRLESALYAESPLVQKGQTK
jgi:RNA polymerase sigma-70 factor (ECF subfamily)